MTEKNGEGEATISGLVIACIDEGIGGRAAGRVADSLARRLGSRLMLATVVQPLPRTPPGGDVTSGLVRRGRDLLAGVARELDQAADIRVAFGEPAERLIALAQREAAELIVVAAPRRAVANNLLLGSVWLALAGRALARWSSSPLTWTAGIRRTSRRAWRRSWPAGSTLHQSCRLALRTLRPTPHNPS